MVKGIGKYTHDSNQKKRNPFIILKDLISKLREMENLVLKWDGIHPFNIFSNPVLKKINL